MPLRNGKSYADATSGTGTPTSHQILSTPTLDSTQHYDQGLVTDSSFVIDSEVDNLNRTHLFSPGEIDTRTPVNTDADNLSMPAAPADAADALPAKNNYNNNNTTNDKHQPNIDDIIVLDTSSSDESFEMCVIRGKENRYTIGDDGTRHPTARALDTPEIASPRFSGPMLFNNSFADMLEQDAQPRHEDTVDTQEIEFSQFVNYDNNEDSGHKTLLERIGIDDSVHLMSARTKKRENKRKHKDKHAKVDANKSTYDEKGKGREPGTRPAETEQIRLDKEFAEKEQARIFNEAVNKSREVKTKSDTHSGKLYPKKNAKKKEKLRSHLGLTHWIETPSPAAGSRAPDLSPPRAQHQMPAGGYLAQAWKEDTGRKRKATKHRVSSHTKRRRDRKEANTREWRERSDVSDIAAGNTGLPNDSSPSSWSSSSSSDTDSTEPTDSSTDTTSNNDSSSNDPSSSSSSDNSDDKRGNDKLSNKTKTLLAKTIKYPEPSVYDGKAHLETFETFVFEFTNWIKVNNLPDKYQMMAMKRFLTDKAGRHYMTFAAVDLRKWTVDNYLRLLFNHCFPIHFRSQMRSKFNNCVQGTRSTREFLRELRTLGNRLPDIGEVQIRLKYWDGSNQYLRVEWARAGLDPETSTLTELEVAAERFEMAETLRKGEDKRTLKANEPTTHVDKSGKRNPRQTERSRRYRNKREKWSKWKNTSQGTAPNNNNAAQRDKRPNTRAKNGDARVRKDKLSRVEKDELRAANKCFHCRQPGHLARDCPEKKTVLPTLGALSLPTVDALQTSANSLALFSLAMTSNERRHTAHAQPREPNPNGQRRQWSAHESPTTDRSLADLVTDPAQMMGPEEGAMAALRFAKDLERELNEMPPGPEYKYIAPAIQEPGQSANKRFRARARRHGSSLELFDEYLKRGIDVDIDFNTSVRETAERIVHLLTMDFNTGRFSNETVWPTVRNYLMASLLDPASGLTMVGQVTVPWEVRRTIDPEIFAVVDHRRIPDRKGDIHPIYLFRFYWLTGTLKFLNHVHRCSISYDRIRASLYRAVPNPVDRSHLNRRIQPWNRNRFVISMNTPEKWWIQDSFLGRDYHLRDYLIWDMTFDISFWYQLKSSVRDYSREDYYSSLGSYYSPGTTEPSEFSDLWGSHSSSPILDHVVGGDKDFDLGEPERPEYQPEDGEYESEDDQDAPLPPRRSPRPYAVGPTGMQSPIALGDRSKLKSSLPDLISWDSGSDAGEDNEDGGASWGSWLEADENYVEIANGDGDTAIDLPNHISDPAVLSSLMVSAIRPRPAENGRLTRDRINRIERSAARVKDFERVVPHPIVITVSINGNSARALVDTGSLADFISTKIVDQLNIPLSILNKPIPVQLATTGSRTMVNCGVNVEMAYQNIRENRRFDVINLDNYDVVLGTPFLYQYKVAMGFNPSQIAIGTKFAAPVEGMQVAVIPSKTADILETQLDMLRKRLQEEARDLCKNPADMPLPPLRAINHSIPLIDEKKVYSWRPVKCPDAMKPLWREKKSEYLKSGRWKVSAGRNALPLLILWKPKPGPDGKKRIRTVVDKREQNSNTVKMSSPLPDMETMLRNAAKYKYRSLIDGKDAYEQIRIIAEHVDRTLFNTPDGTMVSLVLQKGDCNGGATYQALMNHIFQPYIGVFMDVYLDDLLIYSDTIEGHIIHVRIILNVLRKEQLYLSWDKMKFFARELVLLGHVITDHGIKMDPNKVDAIEKWKPLTSRDLLSGFLGSVGYLANGIKNIRIPMAVLTPLTGNKKMFRWGPTEQRAFDQIRKMVAEHRNKYRTNIEDKKDSPPINVTCDASLTGAGGHLSQGTNIENAKNIAFWSGKFNSAQQNYPTHERELLAIVESLKRFKHMLFGRRFRIFTDHRALEHLMKQKNLSPRQARWLELLCEFDFEICYLPGAANKLSDALSRMYSNEADGTVRAKSEFVSDIDETNKSFALNSMALRLGEPNTLDTSTTMFQRLGLTGSVVESDTNEKGMVEKQKGRPTARPKRIREDPEISHVPKRSLLSEGLSVAAAVRKDDKADSDDDDEVIPAQTAPRTRSGRAVKPTRRADHNFDELYNRGNTSKTPKPKKIHVKARKPKAGEMTNEDKEEPRVLEVDESMTKDDEPLTADTSEPPELEHEEQTAERIEPRIEDHGFVRATDSDKEMSVRNAERARMIPAVPEPLTTLILSAENIDVVNSIKGNYGDDKFFKLIIENPEQYRNFKYEEGLLYLIADSSSPKLCVPDIPVNGRKIREILISHIHTILAHLSTRKTLLCLRDHVWWKGMLADVTAFCESCAVCRASKSQTNKPFGLLKTLEVPSRPWQSIGIDFVGPLPSSSNRHGSFDMICLIIDHLTSLVHLVPTDQRYSAKHIAEVVFDSVYKLHGLPERIVSDRDSLFTSIFWSHLHKLLGVKLKMSTAYHPQSDGATERANKTMVQMLRQCVSPNQKDWVIKLPAIEFAMNSARSDTTGFSPFFLNYGRTPDAMIWDNNSEYPGVCIFAQRMKDAIMTAHDAVIAARVQQTHQANKHRRASEFQKDDLVYLSTENLNLPKGRARKLVPKYIGPYRIKEVKSPGASYELELPNELRNRGIHPVFHASLLRPHVPNDDRRFPGRDLKQLSAFDNAPREFLVDKIIGHHGKGKDSLFKVTWRSGDSTWMTYRDVVKTDILRTYCEEMGVASVESLPMGKAQEPDDVEVYCGSLSLKNIKDGLISRWRRVEPPQTTPSTYSNSTRMSIQLSDEELQDYFTYDANRALRMVAEDEGKSFNKILLKPAGYDEWASREGTISVANWVAEKRSGGELDVNEIGRKMLKRSLFRTMASTATSSASRSGNGIRRAIALKKTVPPKRPGTPYPKIDGIPLVAGIGGNLQLASAGNGPHSIAVQDTGSSYPYATFSTVNHGDFVHTENLRLRRELEEVKAREFLAVRAGASNMPSIAATPDISLNMMGLSVADTPVLSPVPNVATGGNGDATMPMN